MVHLLSIPLELLVAISSHLPTQDLSSLRLTCKQIEKSLFGWFSQEFFTKKQFMLTEKSLQALVDIAKHETLSPKLTHVIIATNVYSDHPQTFRDESKAVSYLQGRDDQRELMGSGDDRLMLTEAFKNLPNLKVVGIRDFNSNNRRRDGEYASWSSWGATTIFQDTGVVIPFTRYTAHAPDGATNSDLSQVLQSVIRALARAGSKPSEFEILLLSDSMPDSAFHFRDSLIPEFRPLLQSLEKLLITTNPSISLGYYSNNGASTTNANGRALRRFLTYTPNLTHLRLNLKRHSRTNPEVLKWLAESPSSSDPANIDDVRLRPDTWNATAGTRFLNPPAITLGKLTRLELGQLSIEPKYILMVLQKYAPTLKGFCLWRTDLRTSTPDVANPSSTNIKSTVAVEFLESLARMKLQLTNLKLGALQQDGRFISFKTFDDETAPREKEREYTGEKMDDFIRVLITDLVVDEGPRYGYGAGYHHHNLDHSESESDSELDSDMLDDEDLDGVEMDEDSDDDDSEDDDDDDMDETEDDYA